MAFFVLLAISSPITTTANEVQVVQRDISTTIPPSDKTSLITVLGACWGTEELDWNERSRKQLRDVRQQSNGFENYEL